MIAVHRVARSVGTGLRQLSAPRRLVHVHRFRWATEDQFSNGSHYACRCGAVRCGL